ncbi:hypothetical protein OSTOST_13170, partial [Ostertagia ostertagi]
MTDIQQIVLARRPEGDVTADCFRSETVKLPALADGQILVAQRFLSLDPYMRPRMTELRSYTPPFELDKPLTGGSVGEVVESKNPRYAKGDIVMGMLNWATHTVHDGKGLRKIDAAGLPLSAYLGVLGMPSFTAWYGIKHICKPKAGETGRQRRFGLARELDQRADERREGVGRDRGDAGNLCCRAQLAQRALETELATAGLQGDVGAMAVGAARPDGKIELERRAVHGGAAGQSIGSVDRADRRREVGLFADHGQARLRIAEDQRAVVDGEPAKRQRPGRTGLGRGGLRFGDRRRELPVRLALGVDLQDDLRLDQRHLAHFDAARQQGEQRGLHGDRLDLDHVGVLRAGGVEELHAGHRDGRRRQQRERDRPVDHEIAAGRGLHLRNDQRL